MELVVAFVVSIPPTIAALAAWRKARSVDDAVNHRKSGEPRILDLVIDTNERVTTINGHLQKHLTWHEDHNLQTREQIQEMIDDYDIDHPHDDV